jgi:hypothetical protein
MYKTSVPALQRRQYTFVIKSKDQSYKVHCESMHYALFIMGSTGTYHLKKCDILILH